MTGELGKSTAEAPGKELLPGLGGVHQTIEDLSHAIKGVLETLGLSDDQVEDKVPQETTGLASDLVRRSELFAGRICRMTSDVRRIQGETTQLKELIAG